MKRFLVHEFYVPLENICPAENSRQINPAGVTMLEESIKKQGFMTTSPPQVMFPDLNEGDEMTQEKANTMRAVCIDGSHRIAALKNLDWQDPIRCVCFRNIPDDRTRKILSDECNTTTATFVERSTFDQLWFFSNIIRKIQQGKVNKQSRGRSENTPRVTASEVQASWDEAGGQPPQRGAIQAWINIVLNTSTKALTTLQNLTEEGVRLKKNDYKRISKTWLEQKQFQALRSKPEQQALVLELYARLPPAKRTNFKDETEAVLEQAENTMRWIETIRFIVPREEWSTQLEKEVKDWAYVKIGHYSSYIKPHLQKVEASVNSKERDLPEHCSQLDPDDKKILLAEQHTSIRNLLKKDGQLRKKLIEYDEKVTAINNKINQLKLQVNRPTPSEENNAGGGAPASGAGGSGPKGCTQCVAPAVSRYKCPKCHVRHTGGCWNTTAPQGEQHHVRTCKDCGLSASERVENPQATKRQAPSPPGGGGGPSTPPGNGDETATGATSRNKRRRGRAEDTTNDTSNGTRLPALPGSPSKDANNLMVVCRNEWAVVHDQRPLSVNFRLDDLPNLTMKRKAMLIFFAPSPNDPKVLDRSQWSERLSKIAYQACDQLHPKGTIIALVPQPYYDHATQLADSLRQIELQLTLERHGLVVEYGARGGGLVSPKKALHLATGVDHFLIAHRKGDDFTCNPSVVPQSFPGMERTSKERRDPNVAAASVMTEVPYLGACKRFSDNVAVWAIQRFTNTGDTVVTLTADEDGVVDVALGYGRRAEACLVDAEQREMVTKRIHDSFADSWRLQKIPHVSEGGQVSQVKRGTLPKGLREDTTPAAVKEQVRAAFEALEDDAAADDANFDRDDADTDAQITVAKKIASDLGWCIKEELEDEGDL
eukprot:g9087.t1